MGLCCSRDCFRNGPWRRAGVAVAWANLTIRIFHFVLHDPSFEFSCQSPISVVQNNTIPTSCLQRSRLLCPPSFRALSRPQSRPNFLLPGYCDIWLAIIDAVAHWPGTPKHSAAFYTSLGCLQVTTPQLGLTIWAFLGSMSSYHLRGQSVGWPGEDPQSLKSTIVKWRA
jgi:hypothetical protein